MGRGRFIRARGGRGAGALAAAVVVAVVVFAATVAGFRAERYFSSTRFCVGCHSMTYVYEETRRSSHFGPLGLDPECGDCHLPARPLARLWVHASAGARDVARELAGGFSTAEEFASARAGLAHRARVDLRRWDSGPCRSCHANPRPASEFARLMHDRMDTGDWTCIDCHQNLVHKPVPVEDIKKGMEEGRIVAR